MSKLIDLTGKQFGRLTVLGRSGTYQRPSGNKEPTWLCKCECGNEVIVMSSNLKKRGNTLSCGCLQNENRFGARRETECEISGDVVRAKTFEGTEFIVSVCDLDTVKLHRWHINASGYVADEHGRTIHRTLMSPPAVMDVHHINGDKLDNRRSNLLMMTRSEHTSLHQKQNIANGGTLTDTNVGKWIPVTERLPEDRQKILCYKQGKYASCVMTAAYSQCLEKYCDIDFHGVKHGGFFDYDSEAGYYELRDVTHWMPLPPPSKGDSI